MLCCAPDVLRICFKLSYQFDHLSKVSFRVYLKEPRPAIPLPSPPPHTSPLFLLKSFHNTNASARPPFMPHPHPPSPMPHLPSLTPFFSLYLATRGAPQVLWRSARPLSRPRRQPPRRVFGHVGRECGGGGGGGCLSCGCLSCCCYWRWFEAGGRGVDAGCNKRAQRGCVFVVTWFESLLLMCVCVCVHVLHSLSLSHTSPVPSSPSSPPLCLRFDVSSLKARVCLALLSNMT